MKKLKAVSSLTLAMVASLVLIVSPVFASANQQLVFQDQKGTGTFTTTSGNKTPFGFWIWCQTVSSNAYGTDCAGFLYFYSLGKDAAVSGTVTRFSSSGGTVSFTVSTSSQAPDSTSCGFTFGPSVISSGPTNTMSLSCSSPSGSGTDNSVAITLTKIS